GTGQREPAPDDAALSGGRSHGTGGGGRTKHRHADAQCFQRWTIALSYGTGKSANPDGEFLRYEKRSYRAAMVFFFLNSRFPHHHSFAIAVWLRQGFGRKGSCRSRASGDGRKKDH